MTSQVVRLLLLALSFRGFRELRIHGRAHSRAEPVGTDEHVACCGCPVFEMHLYRPDTVRRLNVGDQTFPQVDAVGGIEAVEECFVHLGSVEGEAAVCRVSQLVESEVSVGRMTYPFQFAG